MNKELSPVKTVRSPMVEQVAGLTRERYVQAIAGGIWAINTGYNFLIEKQDALTSVLHGVLNPVNTALYSPQFSDHGLVGRVGELSQGGMYLITFGAAAGVVTNILENRTRWRQGKGTIENRKHSVILAECDGLPLFVDLGQEMASNGKLANVVLTKTTETPVRTSEEENLFKVWIANAGGPEKDFFDTRFWERSGARNADAIVLNSSNLTSSKEAAVVVREQLGNDRAAIVIIATNPEDIPSETADARTEAFVVSPFVELVEQTIEGVKKGNANLFIPIVDSKKVTIGYKQILEQKRATLAQKLEKLDKTQKIRVYLQGDKEGTERKGLTAALHKLQVDCDVVKTPEEAQVVLYFGSGDLTDDSSVMVETEDDPFKNREDVIKLRLPFDRDNEDNAVGHGDGALSFERATNSKLTEILKPHVEYRLSLKDRITRLVRKGAGSKIRRQIAS